MRRGFLLILSFILYQLPIFSQDKTYIQDPTLSVSFLFNDFKSAANVRATSLFGAIRDNQFGKIGEMSPGLGLNYIEGITRHYDVSITLAGSFLDYPFENRIQFNKDYFLIEGDVSLRRKIFSNKYWVSPYLQLGVGASFYSGYYAAFIPAGGGLQVNFFDEAYLLVNAQYRIPVTNLSSYHFFYSVGLAGNIGRKKQNRTVGHIAMPVRQPDSDRDEDGVPDADDVCPDTKGQRQFKGCPDTDGDGIANNTDACPDVAGPAANNGCPDTDNDGVVDNVDKCPTVPGTKNNNGCPEVSVEVKKRLAFAATAIQFETGKAVIKKTSYKMLDEIVQILNDYPDYYMTIDGHTDNVGKPDKNLVLSQDRANSVKNYFVSKGVSESRLQTNGFGDTQPVGDNKTKAGKAQNRRVAMDLRLKN